MDAIAARSEPSKQIDQQQTPAPSEKPKAQALPKNKKISSQKNKVPTLVNDKHSGTFANKHQTSKVQGDKTNLILNGSNKNLNETDSKSKSKELSKRAVAKALAKSEAEAPQIVVFASLLNDKDLLWSCASNYGSSINQILNYVKVKPNYFTESLRKDVHSVQEMWKTEYLEILNIFLDAITCKKSFIISDVEIPTSLKSNINMWFISTG